MKNKLNTINVFLTIINILASVILVYLIMTRYVEYKGEEAKLHEQYNEVYSKVMDFEMPDEPLTLLPEEAPIYSAREFAEDVARQQNEIQDIPITEEYSGKLKSASQMFASYFTASTTPVQTRWQTPAGMRWELASFTESDNLAIPVLWKCVDSSGRTAVYATSIYFADNQILQGLDIYTTEYGMQYLLDGEEFLDEGSEEEDFGVENFSIDSITDME